jgi:hypothetical protein
MTELRVCRKCWVPKEPEAFVRDQNRSSMYRNCCLECNARGAREWYAKNRERAKSRMRDYTQSHSKYPSVRRGRPRRLIIGGKLNCAKCLATKMVTEFAHCTRASTGYTARCRRCLAAAMHHRYHTDEAYRIQHRLYNKQYQKKHRQKS